MAENGFPSMTALLGMLALAGFQNRDKIAEMLRGATAGGPAPSAAPAPQSAGGGPAGGLAGGITGGLGSIFGPQSGLGNATAGGFLGGALGSIVDSFRQNGQGAAADSWVSTGANQSVSTGQVQQALGPDVLAALARQTGLSPADILSRLSQRLPDAVDRYTPDGRMPR